MDSQHNNQDTLSNDGLSGRNDNHDEQMPQPSFDPFISMIGGMTFNINDYVGMDDSDDDSRSGQDEPTVTSSYENLPKLYPIVNLIMLIIKKKRTVISKRADVSVDTSVQDSFQPFISMIGNMTFDINSYVRIDDSDEDDSDVDDEVCEANDENSKPIVKLHAIVHLVLLIIKKQKLIISNRRNNINNDQTTEVSFAPFISMIGNMEFNINNYIGMDSSDEEDNSNDQSESNVQLVAQQSHTSLVSVVSLIVLINRKVLHTISKRVPQPSFDPFISMIGGMSFNINDYVDVDSSDEDDTEGDETVSQNSQHKYQLSSIVNLLVLINRKIKRVVENRNHISQDQEVQASFDPFISMIGGMTFNINDYVGIESSDEDEEDDEIIRTEEPELNIDNTTNLSSNISTMFYPCVSLIILINRKVKNTVLKRNNSPLISSLYSASLALTFINKLLKIRREMEKMNMQNLYLTRTNFRWDEEYDYLIPEPDKVNFHPILFICRLKRLVKQKRLTLSRQLSSGYLFNCPQVSFRHLIYMSLYITKLKRIIIKQGDLYNPKIDEVNFDATTIISKQANCCISPPKVTEKNFNNMITCIDFFTEKYPEFDCLWNTLENCNRFLSVMDNSLKLSFEASIFVQKYTHFRHDCFDYIFKKNILKVRSPFNSEKSLPFIDSTRTPDYFDITDNHVRIIEFTVVMNALRGNFLKGIDKKSSKYRIEIEQLEMKGYSVSYYPVMLSLTEDLDTNIKVWESMGFSVDSVALMNLKTLIGKIQFKYNYLLSYGFFKTGSRDFPLAHEFVDKQLLIEDNWIYQAVKINKRMFYKFKTAVLSETLVSNEIYVVKKTKNNMFYLNTVLPSFSGKCWTGEAIKDIFKDELKIYNEFFSCFPGNDLVYLKGRPKHDDSVALSLKHNEVIQFVEDQGVEIMIYKNANLISMEESDSIDKVMLNNQLTGINTEASIDEIEEGLKSYKDNIDSWMTQEGHPYNVIDSPRRSFLTYVDSELLLDINYSDGIILSNLNIVDVKSMVAKKILTLKPKLIDSPDKIIENFTVEKENYRQASLALHHYLKSKDILHKRISHAINSMDDPTELIKLHKDLKDKQRYYMNKINKVSNKQNLVNLDRQILEDFKRETNWGNQSGYKLYMGTKQNILQLFDDMKMATREINLNFNLPQNDFDSDFFKSLKNHSMNDMKVHYNEIKSTRMFQNSILLSRLAYTLAACSNKTFSSKYAYLDNLCLKEVALIIKGGKKMTSTRKTKIFKLIYPCSQEAAKWNPGVFESNGNFYDETPWMQLSQEVINDMLSYPYKLLANYFYLRESYNSLDSFEMICLPVLLMFHNRRKTEIMLHNMRYLCVNPIGQFSQAGKMLAEFGGPSYSAFDHAIRHGLAGNYMNYCNSIKKWSSYESNDSNSFKDARVSHPFLDRLIINIHDLTFIIYSTYLMSKGHFDQSIEQVNNMKSILDTHDSYMKSKSNHKYNVLDVGQKEEILNDDFGYSPELAYKVGKILSAVLRNKHSANHMNIKWNNIMTEPIDNMANNRGLRDKGKNFFGHKGYYVIYKKIYEEQFQLVEDILKDENDELVIHKKLRSLNFNFSKAQETNSLDQVIFHVVDKSQRGGAREIYVMDYTTKLFQNPLEKMFKFICEFIDNEIISVSSAKRAGLIHKKCFEYRNPKYKTYYLTLDCRKWAPKSNPEKYMYMLLGMRDVLPDDFFLSTIDYFIRHSKKEIHTRKHIFEKLFKNPEYKDYKKYIKFNEEQDSGYLEMPYSFVMGIFNMLSSLMHAGVQIYSKNLLEPAFLSRGYNVDFDMYAHSDDSGGRLSYDISMPDSYSECKALLGKYEFIMKCSNHLMSIKKCNVSENYFELLSILYMNHELLSLLPKFLGNIALTFTGQGLSSDMKQVISKTIELLSNGASNSQAYKSQIILSNMYRNFYRLQIDTQIPALGGICNTWPALYLSYGSAADEVRICQYNRNFYSKYMRFALENLNYELIDGTLNLKFKNIIRMPKGYKDFKQKIKLPEFEDNEWFFQVNKTKHSSLNLYWFRAMLDSNNFAVAVMNINEVRKLFDSLYMAKGSNILGKLTDYSINDLILKIYHYDPCDTPIELTLRTMYSDLFKFFEFSEELNPALFSKNQPLSMKPVTLSMNTFIETPISNFNSLHLATQMCRPELLKYMFSNKRYGNELKSMESYLNNLNVDKNIKEYKNFFDFINRVRNEVNNFYCELPSNRRALVGNQGLLELILSNYSRTERISNNNRLYVDRSKIQVDMNDFAYKYILLYYFYIIFIRTKDDEIATVPINKKLTRGKTYTINSIPTVVAKYYPYPDHLPYLKLIESNVSTKIILDNLNSWTIWRDRQSRIGDEWVGKGKFITKVDNHYLEFSCLNRDVILVEHKINEPFTFSSGSSKYLMNLFNDFNLSYNFHITAEEGKLYFGFNNEGLMGFHTGTNIVIGIANTKYNTSMDNSIFKTQLTHTFNNGKHFIELQGINKRLNTLDEMVFLKNKGKIFETIDWESISFSSRNTFMQAYFKGDFGPLTGVEFDQEDIIEKMTSTDIYKFFVSCHHKKTSITQSIWEDIVANMNISEDIFPSLFENFGLKDLERILPKSKKDNIALYTYYDITNPDLMTLRSRLANIQDEKERSDYIIKVITTIKDMHGLVCLPEIGDKEEFSKFKWNQLNDQIWMECVTTLSDALFDGLMKLGDSQRLDLYSMIGTKINNYEDIVKLILNDQNTKNKKYNPDMIGLTDNSIFIHYLLEMIHSDKVSFAEFARKFRKTVLRNIPRHPLYEDEWHKLIAQMFKWVANGSPSCPLPSFVTRNFAVERVITEPNKVINYKAGEAGNCQIIPLFLRSAARSNPVESKISKISVKGLNEITLSSPNFSLSYMQYVDLVSELIEDYLEQDLFLRKKSYPNKIYLCETVHDMISLGNSDLSNRNIAIAVPYYNPNFTPKKIDFKTSKGNIRSYYIYNCHDLEGTYSVSNKHKQLYLNYIDHYKVVSPQLLPFEIENKLKSINLNLDISPTLTQLQTQVNVESGDTYNEDLLEHLKENFSLSEDVYNDVKKVIYMNLSPIGKFQRIRKLILDDNKVTDINHAIDKALKDVFESQNNKIDIDVTKGKALRLNLTQTSRNPNKIIEGLTSNKIEFKQANCLLQDKYGSIITENIHLTNTVKESLLSSFKIMMKQFRIQKLTEEQATCLVIIDLIKSIKVGNSTVEGQIFDEDMRLLLNNISKKLIDDDDEDDIPNISYSLDPLKYRLGN
jgi:hypothetical protein